jgi:hypothetical protein
MMSSALAATFDSANHMDWEDWLKMEHVLGGYIDIYFIGSQSYKTKCPYAYIHPVYILAHTPEVETGHYFRKPQIDEIIKAKNPVYHDVKISLRKSDRIDDATQPQPVIKCRRFFMEQS